MSAVSRFDIIESPLSGTVLIEASAGTGKTYAISGLYLRLILEKEFEVENILVVTFTVAATGELRERLRGRLRATLSMLEDPDCRGGCGRDLLELRGKYADDPLQRALVERFGSDPEARERLSRAIRNFDEASIFTIHSFCQRALLENAFESGVLFESELEAADAEAIDDIAADFFRKNWYGAPLSFVEFSAAEKVSPAYFSLLARKRPLDPDYILEGGAGDIDADGVLEIARRLDDEYPRFCESWRRDRSQAGDFLPGALRDGVLKANMYSEAIIARMMEQMDAYTAGGLPLATEDLKKFRAASIVKAFRKGRSAELPPVMALCDEFLGLCDEARLRFDGYLVSLKKEFLAYVQSELARRKELRAVRSFDDLIRGMHEALQRGGGPALARLVRRRYAAALIDEFQDTDPVQYSIFTTIFGWGESLLYLIGDPKQAIYGFRGADIFAYMRAAASAGTKATMDVNRRSAPELIGAVNAIFSRVRDPFVFPEIGFTPVSAAAGQEGKGGDDSPGMRIWFIPSSLAAVEGRAVSKERAGEVTVAAIAAETVELVSSGLYAPGDIAVLVRTRHQAREVQESLRSVGIPSVLYGTESVFASIEALEVLHILRAVNDPGSARLLRAALATDIIGLTGDDIARLSIDDNAWEKEIERFFGYHETWERHGFMRMFHSLLRGERVHGRLLRRPDGERVMTNVFHLAELLHHAQREERMGGDGIIKWLSGSIDGSDEPNGADEHQLRLETDENAVTLITMHRSKGLEFPVVFCPFTWDTRDIGDPFLYHDPARGNRPVFNIGQAGDENGGGRAAASREQLAENLRLFYVAVTRAKRRCYLVWGRINNSFGSAPAYLFHNPGDIDGDDMEKKLAVHVKTLDDGAMMRALKELAKSSAGCIEVGEVPVKGARVISPVRVKRPDLRCRTFGGAIAGGRRVTSFSALAQGADAERDYDREYIRPAGPGKPEPGSIFAFPRGARAGSCIHSVFEDIDFSLSDRSESERTVREKLELHGFDTAWTGALLGMASSVLRSPLGVPGGVCLLESLGRVDRLHELEFTLPLGSVTPEGLGRVFESAGGSGLVGDFAASIAKLGFRPVKGFLRGFIDMVFAHGGRYYLLDWKSNHLGDSPPDYSADRMAAEMARHHYILQYHLYAVALHRYLALRLEGYGYARHFGGVFYLFVRGMDPSDTSRPGVFFDLPPAGMIESLGRYFDEGEASR
ncbi:MAG TPA: exodeoxyribonuclease V subunit beta [Spirochaetota bacterium]|nr:exodeoxyribonuclease V subunit beta [Spirochaetota bacterium]